MLVVRRNKFTEVCKDLNYQSDVEVQLECSGRNSFLLIACLRHYEGAWDIAKVGVVHQIFAHTTT